MVSELTALQAQPRAALGKKVRGLRRQGLTPVHLYGRGVESQALQVESALLRRILLKVGNTKPVSLRVEGLAASYIAFVREVQFDPLTESVLHVDFLRVEVTQKMEAEVPVALVGEAPAVNNLGGTLAHILRTIRVECLPLEVPEVFRVDVSFLDSFDKAVRVAEVAVPSGVTVLTDPGQVVALVTPPRLEEVAPAAPAAVGEVELIKPERAEAEEGKAEGEGGEENKEEK